MTTIATIRRDPTTPAPVLVSGVPSTERMEPLAGKTAEALLTWASLGNWNEAATVVIASGRLMPMGPTTGFPPRAPHPVGDGTKPFSDDLSWDGYELYVDTVEVGQRTISVMRDGVLRDHGTKAQQKALQAEVDDRNRAHRLEQYTPEKRHLAVVQLATSDRKAADRRASDADTAFRDAVRAAIEAGVRVADIARMADLSTERVYQIRDGRR